jgi:TonB family protein
MPELNGLDDLRDAVRALDTGHARAEDIESSIQDALLSGAVTRNEAFRALKAATDRRASAGIIERLQLRTVGPWDLIASLSPEHAGTMPQLRVAGPPVDVQDPVAARGESKRLPQPSLPASATPDADGEWVDPDPYAAPLVDRKMIGQLLGGHYRLEREIERGAMGTVYFARDPEAPETPYAVQVLRPEFQSLSEVLAMLRLEVRVTRMLRHPHIARVYALNSDGRDVYRVSEYVEGRTLEARLQELGGRGLSSDEGRPVVDDVCAALAYAHEMDVVHGDLKPDNVVITPSGRAKVRDFGIARAARTRHGRFDPLRVGGLTTAYNSPEMLEGREPDFRDDVYSLACLIYTVISGAHPFGLRSAAEARDLALEMTPLSDLSPEQNAALARALAFDRAERTPNVAALLTGLWSASEPQTAPAAPAVVPEPAVVPDPAVVAAPAVAAAPAVVRAPAAATAVAPAPLEQAPVSERVAADIVAPLPSITAVARVLPRDNESRSYLKPALVVMVLLAVGIGIALVYRWQTSPVIALRTPRTAPDALPVAPATPPPMAAAPAPETAAAPVATPASTPAPAPGDDAPVTAQSAIVPALPNPPAVNVKKVAAGAPPAALIPTLLPLPKAAAAMGDNGNCPYPREAVDQGLTGTVYLLVHVANDGRPTTVKIDRSSGSEVLDQAALQCVEQFGRFAAAPGGTPPDGYMGRMRFKWSFGS